MDDTTGSAQVPATMMTESRFDEGIDPVYGIATSSTVDPLGAALKDGDRFRDTGCGVAATADQAHVAGSRRGTPLRRRPILGRALLFNPQRTGATTRFGLGRPVPTGRVLHCSVMAMVMVPDEVLGLVEHLATERGLSTSEVLAQAIHQFAGRDPELVLRVSRSIERHRAILDHLAAT